METPPHKLQSTFIYRFCLLILLPFVLILAFLLYEANRNSQKNDENINATLSSQVIYNLSQNLNFAQNVATAILENGMLINFLDKEYQSRVDLEYYSSTIYDYVKISNGLSSDLRLRIYLKNESIPLGYNTFYHISDILPIPAVIDFLNSKEDEIWIDGMLLQENRPSYHVLKTDDDYCYLRKIELGNRYVGVILIQMPKRILNSLRPDSQVLPDQVYEMLTTDRTLIYNFTEDAIDERKLAELPFAQPGVIADSNHLYGIYRFSDYPCDIVVATSHSSDRLLIQIMIACFLAFGMVTVFLFIRYSKKIMRDINYCLDAMNHSIDNNFLEELHVERKRQDEISFIADRINYLIERIRKLMFLNIQQQTAAKNAQLIALQHQINPHFLYNTMEIFSSRMELAGLYEESAAMAAFCRILRYNINSDTMLTTLEEELRQIQNYVKIQSMREIDIQLYIDLPSDLRTVPIIRFILQPFVENSVKYRRENATLRVAISAERYENTIRLKIQDNGIGISPRQLDRLNAGFVRQGHGVSRKDKEIGLFNINERLKLFYGDEHHIRASMEGDATTFLILLHNDVPALRKNILTDEAGEVRKDQDTHESIGKTPRSLF